MKQIAIAVLLLVGVAAGCNKPSQDACRAAIMNIKHLHGTDNLLTGNADIDGEIRRCRGGSSREAVACATAAQTREELEKCEFNQTGPATSSDGTGSGSAK